ncbi:hypothetical protein B0H11DRAFT_2198149 [Mycena galericulata]|nr:hypothetical protein B0H11DRAFT_2198149 [Mycena galericulata]
MRVGRSLSQDYTGTGKSLRPLKIPQLLSWNVFLLKRSEGKIGKRKRSRSKENSHPPGRAPYRKQARLEQQAMYTTEGAFPVLLDLLSPISLEDADGGTYGGACGVLRVTFMYCIHGFGLDGPRGERQPRAAVGVWGGKPQPSGPAPETPNKGKKYNRRLKKMCNYTKKKAPRQRKRPAPAKRPRTSGKGSASENAGVWGMLPPEHTGPLRIPQQVNLIFIYYLPCNQNHYAITGQREEVSGKMAILFTRCCTEHSELVQMVTSFNTFQKRGKGNINLLDIEEDAGVDLAL